VCRNALQGVALRRSMSQCAAVCRSVLQYLAVFCDLLQCVALRRSVFQCSVVCYSMLKYVAVYCSVLHYVAMRCSLLKTHSRLSQVNSLQCVAVCCRVLQCVAACSQCTRAWRS